MLLRLWGYFEILLSKTIYQTFPRHSDKKLSAAVEIIVSLFYFWLVLELPDSVSQDRSPDSNGNHKIFLWH